MASIQSVTGNISSFGTNTVESGLAYAKTLINNRISSVSTSLSNVWSGGFAGINKQRVEGKLIPAIEKYCKDIENDIAQFNADGDMSTTFAGQEMQAAAKTFVEAVKSLLQSYVSQMRVEISAVNKAYDAWEAGTSSVASTANENAEEIRRTAESIKLD